MRNMENVSWQRSENRHKTGDLIPFCKDVVKILRVHREYIKIRRRKMEKNMEENNLKVLVKPQEQQTRQKLHKHLISAVSVTKELIQDPIKRNTKNSSRKNMGIPLQRSLVRAVHLQVCIFLLW